MPGTPIARVAFTALVHPASLVALSVLILNDRVLKHTLGNALTGKLSDLAGLVFFPFLVAFVGGMLRPDLSVRVAGATGVAITVVWFSAIKVLPGAGALTEWLVEALTPWSSRIVVDPTDLVALPMLWVAWGIWLRSEAAPRSTTNIARISVLFVVLFATSATSCDQLRMVSVVQVVDGTIWAHDTYGSRTPITDGVSFFPEETGGPEWVDVGPSADALVAEACSPADPDVCFRIVDQETVESTADGGRTWKEEWSYGGRLGFIRRSNDAGCGDPYHAELRDLAVVDKAGPVAVVAAGHDGVVVRRPDGSWQRGLLWEPAPLAEPGTGFVREGAIVIMAGLGMILGLSRWLWPRLAREATRESRWTSGWLLAGQVALALSLSIALMLTDEIAMIVGYAAVIVIAIASSPALIVPWVRIKRAHPRPGMVARVAGTIVGASLAAVPGGLIPLFGWSVGWPARYGAAVVMSIAVVGAAALAAVLRVRYLMRIGD